MKEYKCGRLVPGCEWETRAEGDAEIIRRASDHMRSAHEETHVRENLIGEIRKRITEVQPSA